MVITALIWKPHTSSHYLQRKLLRMVKHADEMTMAAAVGGGDDLGDMEYNNENLSTEVSPNTDHSCKLII